jgi:hypothetical protein
VSDVIAFVVAYSFEGVSVVTGSTCRDAGAVVTVKRSDSGVSVLTYLLVLDIVMLHFARAVS